LKGVGIGAALGIGSGVVGSMADPNVKRDDTTSKLKSATGYVGGSALGGAALGATIGSIVPFIGTAIGAGIGAAGGAIYGAYRGTSDVKAARAGGKNDPSNPVNESNQHLAEIAKLIKDQNQVIVGGGKRTAAALNRGDIERAMAGMLTAQVI
jgi:phage tail tape-measure protein